MAGLNIIISLVRLNVSGLNTLNFVSCIKNVRPDYTLPTSNVI